MGVVRSMDSPLESCFTRRPLTAGRGGGAWRKWILWDIWVCLYSIYVHTPYAGTRKQTAF